MADKRITELAEQIAAAINDVFEIDGGSGSKKMSLANAMGQFGNSKAPAGASNHDGTTATGLVSTLTNQNVGVSDFTLCGYHSVPATAPAATLGLLGLSSSASVSQQAYAFTSHIDTSNNLRIRLHGATVADYIEKYISLTPWAGKLIHRVVTRTGSTVVVAINGAAQTMSDATAGTPPTWADSITSTYLNIGIGYSATSQSFVGRFSRVGLYPNIALSAAEISQLFEAGGMPAYRHRWGSQLALLTSDFSSGPDSFTDTSGGSTVTGNIDMDADGAGVPPSDNWLKVGRTTTTGGIIVMSAGILSRQKCYWIESDAFIAAGSSISYVKSTAVDFGSSYRRSVSPAAIAVTPGSVTALRQLVTTDSSAFTASINGGAMWRSCNAAGTEVSTITVGDYLYLKNVKATPAGCAVFLPLDDGIGYQFKDASSNTLDAKATATGVSHWIKKPAGSVRTQLVYAGTHEPKSLLGQVALESDCVVDEVSSKSTAATSGSGFTLGTTASATRYLSATTATTAKKRVNGTGISNGGAPGGTAASNLDLIYDPDTANITATIDIEVGIKRTKGTAT